METHHHHVLYVEDHDDTRELVTLVLAGLNCRVTTGLCVEEALRLAREHHFDLYMLDSWLPDGSGVDLCKSLREFNSAIPIMFLSGAGYETDRQSAMNNGAQSYLVKPVDMDELCREVSALLNGAKKDPSAGALHMDHLNLCGCSDDEATIGLPLGLAKAS